MKVALVYDRVNKWGGAERVLQVFQEMFPDAELFTSVYSPKHARWAKKFKKVNSSFLNKFPYTRNKHEYMGALMPSAFENHDFSGFDLVVSVTSEAAKGIITNPNTHHVCYCLTPTRYLWSHHDEYFKNPLLKITSKPFVSYLKAWDKIAAQRPDIMVAISSSVQKRIKKYYKRESVVIHPPLSFQPLKVQVPRKDYFLVVSRLVPYKKVKLVIEAFNSLNLPLVVVGGGSEEGKLRKSSADNIKFVGKLTDSSLARYYGSARALIHQQEEDFGLAAVEAIASGTPVIAYKAGGVLDIIQEGKNGIFFSNQDKDSLIDAVKRYDEVSFSASIIKSSVKKFSKENFINHFNKIIHEV